MKILSTYLMPTSGHVRIMGYDTVSESLQARKHIGYLPEKNPLYSEMKVGSFLQFTARAKGVRNEKIGSQVDGVMADLGLGGVRNTKIGNLPKGYRQMVGFAQALINDPPVLILDEPISCLDDKQRETVSRLIRDLSGWRTVVLSSCIPHDVWDLCDRVAIINRGRIMDVDSRENLISRYFNSANIVIRVGEKAAEALKIIVGIKGVRSISFSASTILNVETDTDSDLIPVLAERIVKAGVPLMEIMHKERSFEDIFLVLGKEEEGTSA
ncbi:ATP-binding cassette domain-containing protein [archaeon]|nr:ATP-binding cassette domain-containing protein [archaeon]